MPLELRLLGLAAGGGFPQWNCSCQLCTRCREGQGGRPSLHACVAVRQPGQAWWIINATPDAHFQVEKLRSSWSAPSVRSAPIAGVILTDAELDHTIGLLLLREGASLDVWATPSVLELLAAEFPVRHLLGRYADLHWKELAIGRPVVVEAGLEVTAIALADRPPRYSVRPRLPAAVVAVRIAEAATGRTAVWMPQVPSWSPEVEAALHDADIAYVDGTFWSGDELVRTGTGHRLAGEMGHLPVGGEGGIAAHLAGSSVPHKLLVHINNTNPILDPDGPERRAVVAAGIEVPPDDLTVTL